MISNNKAKALEEAKRIVSYIESSELTKEEKDTIVKESILNFNEHVNPGWLEYRKSVSNDAAIVEWSDSEEHFYDLYGTEFIDCLGGFGIYTCGHRNPEILKTVKAQLDKYALHSQELLDPLRGYLARLMAMITPGDLCYSFFTNGGAEAVEMALKLARLATGGRWYISTVGAFHGKSLGAISMGGKGTYREDYLPMIQQVQHVKYGDAAAMETAIVNLKAVGEKVAAVIIEPIQGEAGVQIPPKGYLKEVREICDRHHVAMIVDEIQTGMGRTGTLWRCEVENICPDIMTYGKAFGGGIMPITGIIARPNMWVQKLRDNPWLLGSPTFGGNPLACAAAISTIKYMLEHDIPSMSKEKGEYYMKKLNELQSKYPTVLKEVRGAGLLICLEFPKAEVGYEVTKELFSRRVMTAGTLVNAKTVRIEPPAVQTYETIDTVIAKLDESLAAVQKKFTVEDETMAS
ncbi:putrescine aminotransferase [Clostridium aminobutyricum]|uniref:Putrescine aminotransferase n=1 Tax=Clostridium aminobutyricum TaxID=33953 RepID=A0A939D7R4_CLOAM|nr:putrescine aminotransferase [Clostridium aminobutyricum]MBN7773064.1 putrescine aminotransferase [Clostridium aminobutyricum]